MNNDSERRSKLKERLTQSREVLADTLQALTPSQMSLPTRNDGWSVEDVAQHIASAEARVHFIVQAVLKHDEKSKERIKALDVNEANEKLLRQGPRKTIPEMLQELAASRVGTLQLLERTSDSDFELEAYHPFIGPTTLYGIFAVIGQHEQIHTRDIQEAIAAHVD